MLKRVGGLVMSKDGSIKAVYNKELSKLLTSLDVYEKFKNGELNCAFCGATVSEKNLLSIFPSEKEVCFCCTKPECRILLNELSLDD